LCWCPEIVGAEGDGTAIPSESDIPGLDPDRFGAFFEAACPGTVGVRLVQVSADGQLRLHVVAEAHPAGIPATHHDGLVNPCGRRLVAFERHPDQVVAEAERVDDLGRARR